MAGISIGKPSQRVTIQSLNFILELDASIDESHERSAELTSFPVENNLELTDHMRFKPREITMTGIISDTPLIFLATFNRKPSVSGGDPNSRSADAFKGLEEVMSTGQVCVVDTSLFQYSNMALISLTTPRDAARGNIAELQMTWREIQFASTITIEDPQPKNAAREKKQKGGSKQSREAPAPVATKADDTAALWLGKEIGAFAP